MSNLTIRARLLLLSGFVLMLMVGSSLYLRSEVVAGQSTLEASATTLNEIRATLQSGSRTLTDIGGTLKAGSRTLQDDVETVARLTIANRTLRTFGELKFWLTDLEVTWLNESEAKADVAGSKFRCPNDECADRGKQAALGFRCTPDAALDSEEAAQPLGLTDLTARLVDLVGK